MPRLTPRLKIEVPDEGDRGWYSRFQRFCVQVDGLIDSDQKVKQFILSGGGDLVWDLASSTMSWTSSIVLHRVNSSRVTVPAGSVELSAGEYFVLSIEIDGLNEEADMFLESRIEVSQVDYVLGKRIGDHVFWVNGKYLEDGEVSSTGVNH